MQWVRPLWALKYHHASNSTTRVRRSISVTISDVGRSVTSTIISLFPRVTGLSCEPSDAPIRLALGLEVRARNPGETPGAFMGYAYPPWRILPPPPGFSLEYFHDLVPV